MKSIAITGIGGFIGLRLAERAGALGWTVRGIDISENAAVRARNAGADVTVGDINDAEALARAFSGCDLVVHTAAVVEEDGSRTLFEHINVDGTRSVCMAARSAGVKRLVQISSIMVYGFDYPPDVTEAGPYAADGNIYNETKLTGERVAMEFNAPERGFGVIVIRPGDVYGAGGAQWVRRPLEMIRKRQFALPDGGCGVMNHVYVDNLIDGIFLAVERDACGQAFNITDDAATPCKDFYQYHARMAGACWLPTAPAWLITALLRVQGAIYALFAAHPPARPSVIRFLTRCNKISCEKARVQLGYSPAIGLQEGMRRVAEQLIQEGQRIRLP